ncbi:MAG: hypothetical protein Q9195_003281 [Heterodermia aff. obscurata]
MYDGLETNLPHMLMQFSDTPFPAGTQLFPNQETVLEYLENYANEIRSLILFHHQVISVTPTTEAEPHGWDVQIQETTNARSIKTERFDAVIVANGHCAWPSLPDIDGLDAWAKLYPESLFHTVSYKNPQAFANKRTLLIGGGPSAADLTPQIAPLCTPPLHLAQPPTPSPYQTPTPATTTHPRLTALHPSTRTARFADNSTEPGIEAILLCTGYAHRFPFLAPGLKEVGIDDLSLNHHIFHPTHPTLAFVEVPEKIVPFPLAEAQAAVIARVFSGRLPFPIPPLLHHEKESHILGPPRDMEYMNALYAQARDAKGGGGKLPKWWDEKAYWLRKQAPEMKKAFNRRGDERRGLRSYEELGFFFGRG